MSSLIKVKLLLFLIILPNIAFSQNLLLFGDDTPKEVREYVHKVINNEKGEIGHKNYIEHFIEKNKDIREDLLFWISADWGYKVDNNKIIKLFDIKGNDLISQDSISAPILNNDKYSISFDGNDYLYNEEININQPTTLFIILGVKDTLLNESLLDSYRGKSYNVYFDNTGELVISSGKKIKIPFDAQSNKKLLTLNVNKDTSDVYINNQLIYSGNLPDINFNGLIIGSDKTKSKKDNYNEYLYELGFVKLIKDKKILRRVNNFLMDKYKISE